MTPRVGMLVTHPVQYLAPWFRQLATRLDLEVFYAHRQDGKGQAQAGFGVEFEWDTPLLDGYCYRWLKNVARRPGLGRFFGCDTPEIGTIVRHGRFDAFVVFGWNTKSYLQAIRSCRRERIPTLIRGDSHLHTARPAAWSAAKYLLYRTLLPRLGSYLTVGKRNRDYLLHYGVPAEHMHFVPHFVDVDSFQSRAAAAVADGSSAGIRARYGVKAGDFLVAFVGKLIDVKRPLDFVRACQQLAGEPSVGRVMGVVVGDGPMRAAVKAMICSGPGTVVLAGFKNQGALAGLYAACDAVVLPSSSETWGLVVNEAQACGKPAIVSDVVGCAPDLIDDMLTGFTYPAGNVAALAQRIAETRSLLATRQSAVASALAVKVRAYSMQAATDALLSVLNAVRARAVAAKRVKR